MATEDEQQITQTTTIAEAQPTADEIAAAADAEEWDDASKEVFGIEDKEEDKNADTTTTTTETTQAQETTTTTTVDPNETEEQKTAREAEEKRRADEASAKDGKSEPNARDTRVAQREEAQQIQAMKTEIREKLYPDAKPYLADGDGDEIKTIEDVMQLINKATGEPFTQEEAGMWLLHAQQNFNKEEKARADRIEEVTELAIDMRDQIDTVVDKYGALLDKDEKLRDDLWAEYEKTLVKNNGVVISAPMSFTKFMDIALGPRAELAETLKKQEDAKQADEQASEEQKKKDAADAEAEKQRKRSDRSDIYGGGKVEDTKDAEEKEWAEAAKAVFG